MHLSLAVVAYLATVAALPLDVVEQAMRDFDLDNFKGILSAEDQHRIEKLIDSNLEARKARFRNLSKKTKLNTTLAAKIEIAGNLMALPEIHTENPTEEKVGIFEINDAKGISEYLFQGDMDLTEEQIAELEQGSINGRQKRQVWRYARKWASNTLNYYFDRSLNSDARKATESALKYLGSHTCINFVQNSNAANRVRVISGDGCSSNLGMRGGEQQLSLGSGCEHVGTAAHEFMHALGLYHTQQRPDRNSYITVNTAAVDPDMLYNFNQMGQSESISYVPYEYGSVMQYDANSFSRGGISMIAKDNRFTYTMGSPLVSFSDLRVINEHYGCDDLCPAATSAKCKNGGTPNPRNCATCNCPLGYGGTICDQKPSGCGEILTATSDWKTKQYNHGDANNRKLRTDMDFCNHWISAPAGQKIQIKITGLYNGQCNYGCPFNGIEIKLGNQTETNPRYCCNAPNQELTSDLSPTPVISYNRFYYSSFTIQFRAIGTASPVPGPSPSPSPSPAPAPKTGDCVDNYQYCRNWAARGYCTNDFYPMAVRAQNCAKSCNFCNQALAPPTTTTPAPRPQNCFDASPYCRTWIRNGGFCENPYYSPDVRRQNCAKSCNLCDDAVPPTTTTTTRKPAPQIQNCFDANPYCRTYIQNGDFCNNPFYSPATRKDNCAKSCGLCGAEQPNKLRRCTDADDCAQWVSNGFCTVAFIRDQHCPASCGSC